MTVWTTKQIYDLDNAMSASQSVNLGTTLAALVAGGIVVGVDMASGTETPAAAVLDVDTGLDTVTDVVVSMAGDPTLTHMWATAEVGATAGHITIKCWKPTSKSDGTPIAATTPWADVSWIAFGTLA